MAIGKKWLVGGLAVGVLSVAAVGAVARHGGGHGWGHHGGGYHHGMHRGWRGGKGLRRMVCGRRAPERIDHMLVRIKHKADITEAQQPAFQEFAETVRSAAAKARQACPPKRDWKKRDRSDSASDDGDRTDKQPRLRRSPIERLEIMENLLAASLEAVRTIRPSAEKLYASLSEEQQNQLRKMRGKKRWWKRHHKRGGYHRGGRDSDAARGSDDTEKPDRD